MLKKNTPFFLLCFSLLVTFFLYKQGLYGDYVFDDSANILENKKIQIIGLDLLSLKSAFWSGEAGPLGRPISMLTFALNYYFTGFDPYYFKLTNLIIHLINGIILYFIASKIFFRLCLEKNNLKKNQYLSLIVSFVWLIHPLNLTSVLYVVQRMTSLSTLFGLLSLLIYVYWRSSPFNSCKTICTWFGIFIFLILAVFSKESGLLFIGLIYWVELCIFKAKDLKNKPIIFGKMKLNFILWFGIVVIFLSLIYISLPYVMNVNLGSRDFNTKERLLSESRVIFFYLKMIFFPVLSDLSLYHDDFEISKNITTPISTLYAILAFFSISIGSLCLFKKFPLILFAWGWFVISHLMESTFISLELIHEHRNYFASIGFIVAVVYWVSDFNSYKVKPLIYLLCTVYVVSLAFTTWQRAGKWSNLVDHAAFEVDMHPKSDRANYQMARIYMKLMNNAPLKKEQYAKMANYYLIQAKNSYMPSNGAWFGELHLASEMGWSINQKTINELESRLSVLPFKNSNIGFLSAFSECQINNYCKIPHSQAVDIIAAGIKNPSVSNEARAELYKILANYFVSVIADYKKGEEFMFDALNLKQDVNGYLLLSQIYRLQHKLELANQQIMKAKIIDVKNIWHKEIAMESQKIDELNLRKKS